MAIDFSKDRWQAVKENYSRWWAGSLSRPLIFVTVGGRDPGRAVPALPHYGFDSFYDLSVPAEAIVDRWDYNLSCVTFLGDAFPHVWPNFGAGVAAAFMGARLNNSAGEKTVWFHPVEEKLPSDLNLRIDPENIWFMRIRDICRAAVERWQGLVQVGMTDLGGSLDIVSTFLPGEKLLLALYDHPVEIERLTWQVHKAWWWYYNELNSVLRPVNPGYTAWTPIFSEEPYYILQCDFCYMIGPAMFDQFVKPELTASCRRLTNAFYHLDGRGQLPHLDSLLQIAELKGIQWIPGDGAPDITHWPQVYHRIREAGKLIQMGGPMETLDTIARQLDGAEGIAFMTEAKNVDEATSFLKRYGAL